MDRGGFNVMSLFARPGTPTQQQQQHQLQQQSGSPKHQGQHVSPAHSYREPAPGSPPKSLDSLFSNLSQTNLAAAASSGEHTPPATASLNNPFRPAGQQAHSHPTTGSGPGTPVSSVTVASSNGSGGAVNPNVPPADRQSALLSLLGSTMGPNTSGASQVQAAPPVSTTLTAHLHPQPLIPDLPPSPPHEQLQPRQMQTSESQGKALLEQLMAGNMPSGYSEGAPPLPNLHQQASMPYPPQPYAPYIQESYQSSYAQGQETPRDMSSLHQQPPVPQPQSQSPPSPSRKSMFDFVSPFDALANTNTGNIKRKAVPETVPEPAPAPADDSWLASVNDPKRKSMENLMDQLTRSQGPLHPTTQQQQMDSYSPDPAMNMLPVDPMRGQQYLTKQMMPGSPRGSPPRVYGPQTQPRTRDSPLGAMQQAYAAKARSEASPVRGGWKQEQKRVPKPKAFINTPIQSQSIIFDVNQNQESIQASRDCVKSTAIALVKVESTFLPGTTIGATHWVAYAMTRGRVRVISRSSGDRTLLQLPTVFNNTISVTDMAVYGNRLAGITSDGGFVVWELPEVITDDVPGKLLVCIVPSPDFQPLHSVKWHPKDSDTLAVASDNNIYLFNVLEASETFGGAQFTQRDLRRVSSIFPLPSYMQPLIAFDFDIRHQALATVSEDSELTLWDIPSRQAFWSEVIPGEGVPSSLTFLDRGVVIGRNNGNVLQLLPIMGNAILSTVKFVNGARDDPDMFGHVTYDSRIQTLWVANSKRDSLIALKVCFELSTPSSDGEDLIRGGYFEQVVEFVGPKPTLNFVILTGDADPSGEEANAACVAAKLPPGELALVAFSVHSSGVDQVLIRREWYDAALMSTTSKIPSFNPTMVPPPPPVQQRSVQPQLIQQQQPVLSQPIPSVPIRLRTPPSEEVETEQSKDEGRPVEMKNKSSKSKNVGWKDRDDSSGTNSGKSKEKEKSSDAILNETPVGVALTKELRRVEESLHTRIGRLVAKELDKQQQRLEEARAHEQAADFARQEKILKLISTELTKNTTRVVESAVKGEVQDSVLPSLENITRVEIKSAINTQIAKGVSDSVRMAMPPEIEKMFIKPEVSNQVARNLCASLTPVIERHVKDTVSKTLLPAYQAQTQAMHQDLSREIRSEVANLKKEIISWQSDAFRSQESMIRDMEQTIRGLSEQMRFISLNAGAPRGSPTSNTFGQSNQSPSHSQFRPNNLPPMTSGPSYQQSYQPSAPTQPSNLHTQWYGPNLPGPTTGAAAAMPSQLISPPASSSQKSEEWDDTYLAVLGTQDLKQLRELLARSNPEIIMPSNGPGPLSQAVILTLVHRLAGAISETSPVEETFKSCIWWLQRAATTLNTSDPLVSPYVKRVLTGVLQTLNTTKQRLSLLPGGPQLVDSTRVISDIQETLSRKPAM